MKHLLPPKWKKLFDRSITLTLSFLTILSLMPAMAWQSLAEELGGATTTLLSTIQSQEETLPFSDVNEGDWY